VELLYVAAGLLSVRGCRRAGRFCGALAQRTMAWQI